VTAGSDIDLLAGELDLHDHAHGDEAAPGHSWQQYGLWAAGAAAGLGLLIVLSRRLAAARQRHAGAAA
jgi:allophanate hydrolase subunit 1